MNWKQESERDLKRYAAQKESLTNIAERINILSDSYTALKCAMSDKIPMRGGSTQIEDRLLDNIVERERLKHTYKAAHRLVKLMDRGLSALDDKELRALEMFYIHRQKNHAERLMEEWNYEKRQVYNIKDRALYKFTINMYGLTEY